MAGCVLRVYGDGFDPSGFLARSTLAPCAVWHKGEQRLKGRPPSVDSGFTIAVSDADDLPSQVRDAIQFLTANQQQLVRLRGTPGLGALVLDFGIERREVAAQFDFFPPQLLLLAGQLGMGIALSQYETSA